jgi:hypothetical protein
MTRARVGERSEQSDHWNQNQICGKDWGSITRDDYLHGNEVFSELHICLGEGPFPQVTVPARLRHHKACEDHSHRGRCPATRGYIKTGTCEGSGPSELATTLRTRSFVKRWEPGTSKHFVAPRSTCVHPYPLAPRIYSIALQLLNSSGDTPESTPRLCVRSPTLNEREL